MANCNPKECTKEPDCDRLDQCGGQEVDVSCRIEGVSDENPRHTKRYSITTKKYCNNSCENGACKDRPINTVATQEQVESNLNNADWFCKNGWGFDNYQYHSTLRKWTWTCKGKHDREAKSCELKQIDAIDAQCSDDINVKCKAPATFIEGSLQKPTETKFGGLMKWRCRGAE